MKMTKEDYNLLEVVLFETIKVHNLHPYMVKNSGHAWQVFHKAWNEGKFDGNGFYKKYNDSNIETAMRKMFSIDKKGK